MFDVVFSSRGNDFYREICRNVVDDLNRIGQAARALDLVEVLDSKRSVSDNALLISWGEMKHTLPGDAKVQKRAVDALKAYTGRVLLNFDSLQSPWFKSQFTGDGVVTAVIDIGMLRQKKGNSIRGVPYRWMPECLTQFERANLQPWTPDRPIRWCMLAHQTKERVKLVGDIVHELGPKGFLWLPGLRPFVGGDKRSLSSAGRSAVLRATDFYVWTSHHPYPYHEGLRAVHAVSCGAIPVKIDPVYSHLFSSTPWVYGSLRAVRERCEEIGLLAMYEQARDFLLSRGNLGEHLRASLVDLNISASGRGDELSSGHVDQAQAAHG